LDDSNTALQAEIQRRQQSEDLLFEAKERAEVTLHSIGDAVITTDARGRVDYLNPVATKLTGWTLEEAHGKPLTTVFPILNEITRAPVDTPVDRVLREGVVVGLANHTVLVTRDNLEIAIEDSAAPIRNRAGETVGVVLVFHDVTQSRELANLLTWQASHDALTGLINRREFENRLSHALAIPDSASQEHVLLYMDLDQFKVVNDTSGHVAGDELLRQLSRHLQKHLRANDTLARLGGDEFGVLLENCPLDHAQQIAETLREATAGYRFNWENRQFEIGVSIGIVPVHPQSGSVNSLFAAADMACYAAKESGRNRIHLYHETDSTLRQRHGEMLWVSRLNDALKDGSRLLLYRQKIAPLNGHGSEHYEVLVRLRGENGDVILPEAFLPAAERYNLMPQIDRWVVTSTISRLDEYRDGDKQCLTAINLSGASLGDERFLDFIRAELEQHSDIPCRLCFEITETAAITNLARAAEFMHELRDLGCRFALDDFGTGLSSFGYLKNLPVDFLKIDGSLVRGIVGSKTDFAMVQAINNIGHTLGIQTIAEYVENDAIRQRLAEIHVDYAQGFGIALPEIYPMNH
ncbi:MAG: EAL domain-containing protein, partial [Gammaproteobacteria bacterium]|nr:EAL domain-containing protein [Gammaproteobacteria bacterium]